MTPFLPPPGLTPLCNTQHLKGARVYRCQRVPGHKGLCIGAKWDGHGTISWASPSMTQEKITA